MGGSMATDGMTTGGAMMTTTTDTSPSTVAPTTTTDAIHNIIANVFCQNAASISCATGFEIICGTDGQLYPNQCELSKAKCKDPTLDIADQSACSVPPIF